MAADKPASTDSVRVAELREYRQSLVAAEQKCQDDFDKTVLSLSGGALGVSFIFVKDIVGSNPISNSSWLLLAWLAWAFSSLAVLMSFFSSHLALRKAIQQCDNGTIYGQKPGGLLSDLTRNLNAAGALLFFCGLCLMTAFVFKNLPTEALKNVGKKASHPTPAATTVAATASPKR